MKEFIFLVYWTKKSKVDKNIIETKKKKKKSKTLKELYLN